MQRSSVAARSSADEEQRPHRPTGNRTRSPSRQPAASMPERVRPEPVERLQLLEARIVALEKAQVDNVHELKRIQSEVRLNTVGMDDLRTEISERSAETIERIDKHHVRISRVTEQLENVLAEIQKHTDPSAAAPQWIRTLSVKLGARRISDKWTIDPFQLFQRLGGRRSQHPDGHNQFHRRHR